MRGTAFVALSLALAVAGCSSPGGRGGAPSGEGRSGGTVQQASGGQTPETAREDTFEGGTAPVEARHEIASPGGAPAILDEIRTSSNANYDRVVFEFRSDEVPGYRVEYVRPPVRQCASGEPVDVQGAAYLSVHLSPAQAHDESGAASLRYRERSLGFPVVKQMVSTCDFEGDLTWVLGVASANNFRVLELTKPARIVVDIKHSTGHIRDASDRVSGER